LNLRGREWQEAGKDYIVRSFTIFTTSPNIIRAIKSRRVK